MDLATTAESWGSSKKERWELLTPARCLEPLKYKSTQERDIRDNKNQFFCSVLYLCISCISLFYFCFCVRGTDFGTCGVRPGHYDLQRPPVRHCHHPDTQC